MSSQRHASLHTHLIACSAVVVGVLDAPNGSSFNASGILDRRVIASVLWWNKLKYRKKDPWTAKYGQSFPPRSRKVLLFA
jgi:hypothetical protein